MAIDKTSPAINADTVATIDSPYASADSNAYYFPLNVLGGSSNRDSAVAMFLNSWYSKHLFALKEPVLFSKESKNEIYRFTWLRTFHNPVAIRIEKHNDTCLLYWRQADGYGGYDPGKLTIAKHKIIDKSSWDEFIRRLAKIDFWNLSTNEEKGGFDGSRWILEGKTKDSYHVTDRWTPEEKSDYYQCCNFLIELTDLIIEKQSKY